MLTTRSSAFLTSAACLALASACSGDQPTASDYDDVAQALGGLTATENGGGEVGTMRDAAAIASGDPADGLTLQASGGFSGSRLGLQYDYSVACSDAEGAALPDCGEATDKAEIQVAWSGELKSPRLEASVVRLGELTLTDVQSDTVSIEGESDLEIDARFESLFRDASRAYRLAYHAEYAGVKVQRSPARITEGRVSYALAVEREAESSRGDSSASFDIDAELVFGADGATLTLDGEHTYAVNQSTGRVTKK